MMPLAKKSCIYYMHLELELTDLLGSRLVGNLSAEFQTSYIVIISLRFKVFHYNQNKHD